ncbi:MAG: hypothetical protein IJC43_01635 [Clostridia bacterium]|nr:hypothetical protein [Clostridia bacterium]
MTPGSGQPLPPEDTAPQQPEPVVPPADPGQEPPPLTPAEAERKLLRELARQRYTERAIEAGGEVDPSPWVSEEERRANARHFDDSWALTPGYTRCPRCHEPLDKGVCAACGERVELPPLPTWQAGVFAALFLLVTGIFTLWQGLGWKGLPLALGGACCVMLALSVVWLWASLRHRLDKRMLLRCLLATMAVFVLDLVLYAGMALMGAV